MSPRKRNIRAFVAKQYAAYLPCANVADSFLMTPNPLQLYFYYYSYLRPDH